MQSKTTWGVPSSLKAPPRSFVFPENVELARTRVALASIALPLFVTNVDAVMVVYAALWIAPPAPPSDTLLSNVHSVTSSTPVARIAPPPLVPRFARKVQRVSRSVSLDVIADPHRPLPLRIVSPDMRTSPFETRNSGRRSAPLTARRLAPGPTTVTGRVNCHGSPRFVIVPVSPGANLIVSPGA